MIAGCSRKWSWIIFSRSPGAFCWRRQVWRGPGPCFVHSMLHRIDMQRDITCSLPKSGRVRDPNGLRLNRIHRSRLIRQYQRAGGSDDGTFADPDVQIQLTEAQAGRSGICQRARMEALRALDDAHSSSGCAVCRWPGAWKGLQHEDLMKLRPFLRTGLFPAEFHQNDRGNV